MALAWHWGLVDRPWRLSEVVRSMYEMRVSYRMTRHPVLGIALRSPLSRGYTENSKDGKGFYSSELKSLFPLLNFLNKISFSDEKLFYIFIFFFWFLVFGFWFFFGFFFFGFQF